MDDLSGATNMRRKYVTNFKCLVMLLQCCYTTIFTHVLRGKVALLFFTLPARSLYAVSKHCGTEPTISCANMCYTSIGEREAIALALGYICHLLLSLPSYAFQTASLERMTIWFYNFLKTGVDGNGDMPFLTCLYIETCSFPIWCQANKANSAVRKEHVRHVLSRNTVHCAIRCKQSAGPM